MLETISDSDGLQYGGPEVQSRLDDLEIPTRRVKTSTRRPKARLDDLEVPATTLRLKSSPRHLRFDTTSKILTATP